MDENSERTKFLLRSIRDTDGFVREEFTSAAGIRGNLKVELPTVLDRSPEAMSVFAGVIAEEVREVELLVATGGAVSLCREVERLTGKSRAVVRSVIVKGVKNFSLCDHAIDLIHDDPTVGVIEDVSSTFWTIERMLAQTGLGPLATKIAVGFRRGRPAPTDMSHDDIDAYNKHFAFRELYEHDLGIPVVGVIEKFLPLWIPVEPQINNYLPELAEVS
jgi:hypothetical protein